ERDPVAIVFAWAKPGDSTAAMQWADSERGGLAFLPIEMLVRRGDIQCDVDNVKRLPSFLAGRPHRPHRDIVPLVEVRKWIGLPHFLIGGAKKHADEPIAIKGMQRKSVDIDIPGCNPTD